MEEEQQVSGGSETILLVDDEEIILSLCRDFLESYGYQVITANSGEKAVEILKAERGRIGLITLDLGMPGMSGDKCLGELLKIDPEAKIIIASGCGESMKTKELLKTGARAFIGKPYRYLEIVRKVREVLDEA